MDIVVTIPKTRKKIWLEEIKDANENDLELLFALPTLPKMATKGDKCYVCLDGQVIGYHTIKDIKWVNGFTCETTGKYWMAGVYAIRSGSSWTPLDDPIQMKGFQGFRYYE